MRYLSAWILIFVLWLFLPESSFGQYKFEKETRIDRNEVPSHALSFIDSCFIKKVKWYLAESYEGQRIEAKAKLGKHMYCIEFDTSGCIQDVEKEIKFRSLDPLLRNNIRDQLKTQFSKFRIVETHVQWNATNPTLQLLVKSGSAAEQYSVRYELIIKARKDGRKRKFEVLFDEEGKIEKVLKLIDPSVAS